MHGFVVIVLLVIVALIAPFVASRCDICDTPFKRNRYQWTIRGRKVWLCPNCSSRIERQKSRLAFDPDADVNIPDIPERPRRGSGLGLLALLVILGGGGYFLWLSMQHGSSSQSVASTITSPSLSPTYPIRALPTPSTPKPLPLDVALTTAIQMPVSIGGTRSGTVTLQRGTRVRLVSVGRDSVVIRYLNSSATVPTTATDLQRTSP
jgi:hypothetical protein